MVVMMMDTMTTTTSTYELTSALYHLSERCDISKSQPILSNCVSCYVVAVLFLNLTCPLVEVCLCGTNYLKNGHISVS